MAKNFTEIVAKFKSGDRKAFQLIFHHYYKRIYLLCLKYFYNQEDTEEIIQDIFVKLWMKRGRICEEKNVDAFVYTLAKNHIINDLKRKLVIKSREQEYYDEVLEDSRNDVEEAVLYHELDELLNKALNLLPEKRREIFSLSRKEGLTNREISEKLNISQKTVETHMKLALDYFKKIFESRIPNSLIALLASAAILYL